MNGEGFMLKKTPLPCPNMRWLPWLHMIPDTGSVSGAAKLPLAECNSLWFYRNLSSMGASLSLSPAKQFVPLDTALAIRACSL